MPWYRRTSSAHLAVAVTFACLAVPTLTVWKESVPWLQFLSVFAIIYGAISAWEAAKAKEEARDE